MTENLNHTTPGDAAPPTAAEAAAALAAAGSVSVVSAGDVRTLQRVLLGIGVAMGAVLLLVRATGGNPVAFVASMAAYGVVIALLVALNSRVKAVPRGYTRLYGTGIAVTSAVYAAGIALTATTALGTPAPWVAVVALALATAAPAALCAHRIGRLGPR